MTVCCGSGCVVNGYADGRRCNTIVVLRLMAFPSAVGASWNLGNDDIAIDVALIDEKFICQSGHVGVYARVVML